MRSITFAAVAVAMVAACQDPELSIRLEFPEETLAADELALELDLAQLQISVFEFSGLRCADLRYGRISAEVQDESLRSRVVLPRGASGFGKVELGGVPRLGPKVIAVLGLDGAGQMLAGGCVDVDDIEDDLALTIAIERSLIVRVLPSPLVAPSLRLPAAVGAELPLFARYRRRDSASVPATSLQVTLRAEPTEVEAAVDGWTITPPSTEEAIASSIYTIGGLDAAISAVGPVELVVRAPWSDQVNRVSAGVAPALVGGVQLDQLDGPNQVPPSWAVFEVATMPGGTPRDHVVAVARYRGSSGALQVVVARERDNQLVLQPPVAAPGVRSLTVFRGGGGAKVVGRTATGWVTINWELDPPTLTAAPLDTATAVVADQLLGVPACGGVSAGVLGVVGTSVLGWQDVTGEPPVTAAVPIGALAAKLGVLAGSGASVELLGAACLLVRIVDDVEVEQPVVAMRVTSLGRAVTFLATPELDPIVTPFVGGITAFLVPPMEHPSILAVTVGASGPRVGSFRLRYDDPGVPGALPPALIPDSVIDHPLSTAAIAVTALRGSDGALDSFALHALPGTLGLSMTRGSRLPGQELSAMSMIVVDGTDQQLLRVGFAELPDGTVGRDEVMVAGDQGLAIFDLTKPMEKP